MASKPAAAHKGRSEARVGQKLDRHAVREERTLWQLIKDRCRAYVIRLEQLAEMYRRTFDEVADTMWGRLEQSRLLQSIDRLVARACDVTTRTQLHWEPRQAHEFALMIAFG